MEPALKGIAMHAKAEIPTRMQWRTFILMVGSLALGVSANAEWRVAIRIDPDSPILGEPVTAWVRLENLSSTAAVGPASLEPEQLSVRYYAGNGGQLSLFTPLLLKEHSQNRRSFAPGEVIEEPARIFFGARGWTFARPGRYTVRVVISPDVHAETEFTIREAQSTHDTAAAEAFLRSSEVGAFLILNGGDHLAEARATLTRVAAQTDSRLGSYADAALGLSLSAEYLDLDTGALRAADLPRAIVHLARATQNTSSAYFTARTGGRLAALYEDAQQLAAARQSNATAERLAERRLGGGRLGIRAVMDKEKN
jgi:hypothetical protein